MFYKLEVYAAPKNSILDCEGTELFVSKIATWNILNLLILRLN